MVTSDHMTPLSQILSDHDHHHHHHPHTNSLILTSSSLSSQPSLPSLPSLDSHPATPPPPLSRRRCTTTVRAAHASYVSGLAMYNTGTLVSCSPDQTLKLWRVTDRNELARDVIASGVSKSPIKSVLVSSKDRTVFTSHHDGKIRAWRAGIKETNYCKVLLVAVLPTVKDRFFSILSPKKYVQVRRHKRSTWVNHTDAVSALALSCDGNFLYSASWDRTFKVWRTCDFKCIESISRAHEDAVNAIAVSEDGVLYTGSADTKIKAWKRLPGERKHSLVSTMERHKSAVNALALNEDSSVLYSGACDRSVVVWVGAGGSQMVAVGALRGHKKAVLCLAVSKVVVCSGSADKTIRIWRHETERGYCYQCLAVLEGHAGAVKSLAIGDRDDDVVPDCESEVRSNNKRNNGGSCVVYSGGMDCEIKAWKVLLVS